MIDLILIVFFAIVWYGGFWCGNRFHSVKEMWRSFLVWMGKHFH